MPQTSEQHTLKRTISLPFVIFYGLGTMVGGGIYALTGEVAGLAGMYAPMAFLIAASLALITAFSYAELVTHLPFSSGEAHYIQYAFAKENLTKLIGWMVVFMGVTSAAMLTNAATGFVLDMVALPKTAVIIVLVCYAWHNCGLGHYAISSAY